MKPLVPLTSPAEVRSAFARYPTGVAALAAVVEDAPTVVVASSFQVGISLEPPLALFAIQHNSRSWDRLADAPSIGVSVLGHRQAALARQLASPDTATRMSGAVTHTAPSGALFITGGPVWMQCAVHASFGAGDHDVVLLRLEAIALHDQRVPLVWHESDFPELSGWREHDGAVQDQPAA